MNNHCLINRNKRFSAVGFTLLELLVAIALLAAVFSMIYPAYTGTYRTIDTAEAHAEIYQMARITMDRIIHDLESANIPDISGSSAFLGRDVSFDRRNSGNLRFISRAHVSFGNDRGYSGNAKIAYYAIKNEEKDLFTLYRSDVPESREWPEEETGGLILCDKIYSINFIYHDAEGNRHDYWDSNDDRFRNLLPSRVSMAIEFYNEADPENTIKFSTAVMLPLSKGNI